ncbi:prolyl oligopeptidase family protein [Capnocytophaga sp. oral taxon 878]|uniref:prolyl oligopeptidase family serine peptidase n=1 Tax=Capnocytophaga sp. oral taxon 878 TaxID=1316596 RepID=UPI000D023DFC|nr:prolyl oligopeptidase family serine peptidase [Capnocytophaga sp. oral taxon 878]AVM50880.1 S9 family peptidase [Capnocytophaga sp. oral taxon 878]
MKQILFSATLLALVACNQTAKNDGTRMDYPETKKGDVVDTYFGTQVPDPYRWLEDDRSAETAAWVKTQNEFTGKYLQQIPYREGIKKELEELWNYERVGLPFTEGNYIYYYRNSGLKNQSVVFRKDKDGKEEVFLDPNTFSADGTTSLSTLEFSEDGSLVAYLISEGGSDWRKGIVLNAETKERIGDTLVDIKFSGVAWKGNEGFFYSSYDKPKGSELSAKTDRHKLYYHKLGKPQKEDELIFGGKEDEKYRYVSGVVSSDGRYLFISMAQATSGNKLVVKDLNNATAPLVVISNSLETDTDFVDMQGSTIYLQTNLNAPNKRLVKVDIAKPQSENWVDVIPETENVLSISLAGGYIFAQYMVDAVSEVKQYDYNGKFIRQVEFPNVGTASGFSAKKNETRTYYSFTNYATPTTLYEMDLVTGKTKYYWRPFLMFNSVDYESKQVFYNSKDGTRIPMIITYKKGLKLDGNNPTLLYGYGGFNVSLQPRFSVPVAVWIKQGGVYAVPNLRGGGEYGKKWHDAGTKMQKQNVFDDFIAAAEYLIKEKYTSPNYLAIKGGSNGGLLVGATMLQRPDLFKVAIPEVGVLDMLRYHTFTAGAGWAYDYGTAADSKEMFEYLKNYSPLHNVKQGVNYPATLVTTGDHDDRVVPAHSFKFAAELQAKQTGDNPVLIRIETNAGHGAGTPVSKVIELNADIQAFILWNMGIRK